MPTVTRSHATTRGRRSDSSALVLEAAMSLMADGTPYTELPMQRIAEQSGVARSTVYLLFPDKAQLLISLAGRATEGLFDTAIAWWRAEHIDGLPGLISAMQDMVGGYRRNARVLNALSEVSAYDPDVAAYWLGRVGEFIGTIVSRLQQDQASAKITPHLDPATTAQILTWMVERSISLHCRLDTTGTGDAQLTHDLARAIWLTVYGDVPA